MIGPATHPTTARGQWAFTAMWLLAAAAFVNAVLLARVVANPMIMADNWLFVDTFLRHAIDERPGLGDFLVKRAGLDHGLPHYKLLMLLNARYFGLDFSVEAFVGVVFGLVGWGLLYAIVASDAPRRQRDPQVWLLMAAMAAVYLSLNSFYIYLYSMVTLSYLNYLLALLMFFTAWRALQGRSLAVFALASLVYAIAADTSAVLTGIALSMALALTAWHSGRWRRTASVFAVLAVALLVAHVVYAEFGEIRGSTLAVFNVSFRERIAGLAAGWHDAWRWVATPAASGLASKEALMYMAGSHWQAWQIALALTVVAAHGWFWRTALRHAPGAAAFVAVCAMLLFYGYLAGLLYGRVFLRGSDYLDQPRYIALYQIGMVALLLMLTSRLRASSAAGVVDRPAPVRSPARMRAIAGVIAVALLALQVPLTLNSWAQVPRIRDYYRAMATQYGEVLRDPAPRRFCVDQLTLCELPSDVRVRVIDMLHRHRLNLWSPRFQRRHPDLAAAAFATPAAAPAPPP